MRVLFVGQTGVEKDQAIRNFAALVDRRRYRNRGIGLGRIGTYCVESEIKNIVQDFTSYLSCQNETIQRDNWRCAFQRILAQIRGARHQDIYLAMHLAFYRDSNFFSPVDWQLLRRFRPDAVVTLIDDIYDVWKRIEDRTASNPASASHFRLREIVAWRSAETLVADWLPLILRKPSLRNFVVAAKHPSEMLYRLLYEPAKLRVYASFPISKTRDSRSKRAEIDSFRRVLHRRFCVFDPLTIDEKILERLAKQQKRRRGIQVRISDRWAVGLRNQMCPVERRFYPIVVPREEVQEVTAAIGHHISERDYRLIRQANCVAVYRPYYGKSLHEGVSAEIKYATHTFPIPRFMVFPNRDGDPQRSPFHGHGVLCGSVRKLVDNLRRFEQNARRGR